MFLQACVILFTGGVPGPLGGGVWSRGVPGPRGTCSGGMPSSGGCLMETPQNGYCCGRYASYWNAFLLNLIVGYSNSFTVFSASVFEANTSFNRILNWYFANNTFHL